MNLVKKSQLQVEYGATFQMKPGYVLANKYRLTDKVGQGSFGHIFKAEDLETQNIHAVKLERRSGNKAHSLLVREIKVLMVVKREFGFPQLVN